MTAVFNPDVLAELLDSVGGDMEFLTELVDTFFEDAPRQFSEMEDALQANDAQRFRRAAHSLKSNAASFGAEALAAQAKQLEDLGKEENLTPAPPVLTQAAATYEETATALRQHLSQGSRD